MGSEVGKKESHLRAQFSPGAPYAPPQDPPRPPTPPPPLPPPRLCDGQRQLPPAAGTPGATAAAQGPSSPSALARRGQQKPDPGAVRGPLAASALSCFPSPRSFSGACLSSFGCAVAFVVALRGAWVSALPLRGAVGVVSWFAWVGVCVPLAPPPLHRENHHGRGLPPPNPPPSAALTSAAPAPPGYTSTCR